MRILLRTLLEKIAALIYFLSKKVYQFPAEKRVISWFENQGDKTLRLNYDLNEDSIVFDLGGYEGQWASDIFSRYCCHIHIFEPVIEYANRIENIFLKNKKIVVHKIGLSDNSKIVQISVNRDESSVFKQGKDSIDINLVRALDFIKEKNIKKIDLMKINIEGGEYELLEHLINTGFMVHIKNIQVQFHDFIADAEQRMVNIQSELAKTHSLTWQYPFVWENWTIKDDVSKVDTY